MRRRVDGVERRGDLLAIASRRLARLRRLAADRREHRLDHPDRARDEIERSTGVQRAIGAGELADDTRHGRQHARRQQRAARARDADLRAHVLDERRRYSERDAVVAAGVRVPALELGAVAPEQQPAGPELAAARRVVRVIRERPAADQRDAPAGVGLGIGPIARPEPAADVAQDHAVRAVSLCRDRLHADDSILRGSLR